MFAQLGKLPLSKNPFFIKSIAMSGQFDGEGTEGMTPGANVIKQIPWQFTAISD
jgi:hypothetical protein